MGKECVLTMKVIKRDGTIVEYNAEKIRTAIKKANKVLDDWRLDDCEMYVTTEPCQMCAGAIVQARVKKVYIGCMNPKAGCAGSIMNLFNVDAFNHQVESENGILEEECSMLLKEFFRNLRNKK